MRRPWVFISVVLAGVGLDLFTKWYVFHTLSVIDEVKVIPGIIHIVRAENYGVAFSMFSGRTLAIEIIAAVMIVVLCEVYRRNRNTFAPWILAVLSLMLIGAIGNLHDRLMFNYVRDFIDFKPHIPLVGHWAVFNVADICITMGVLVYVGVELWTSFMKPPTEATQQTE